MSKLQVYNYYFGSDIFNRNTLFNHSKIANLNRSINIDNTPKKTFNISSNCNDSYSNNNTNTSQHRIQNHSRSIETSHDAKPIPTDNLNQPHYASRYNRNQTPLGIYQNKRLQRLKTVSQFNRSMEYTNDNTNAVKTKADANASSALGIDSYLHIDSNTQTKKAQPKTLSINRSLSYLGEDMNKSPLEISMKMKQSNIFNNAEKENDNSVSLKNKIQQSKTPIKLMTQECISDEAININFEHHPKGRRILDKTITKGDEIKIVKDFFKKTKKESVANMNMSRHINNVSTLYDKDYYPQMYGKEYKMTHEVVHKFEIRKTDDYNAIDTKRIKQLFRKKGINVFGTENHDSFSYGNQKCIMNIRINDNNPNQTQTMNGLINEIENSTKVNINEVKDKVRKTSIGKSLSKSNGNLKTVEGLVNHNKKKSQLQPN